jgi:diadenosine tetraphosphate (Ap4A) HIT family hydrolase
MTAGACYACTMSARNDELPPRERVHAEGGWRIAHAFDSTLPGWLVLVPLRHVTAMEEMGLLARRSSIALKQVTGCSKTYLMLFAEAEGFAHLHLHVVPRMADFPPEVRGPGVFALTSRDEADWIPESERDALARELRVALAVSR